MISQVGKEFVNTFSGGMNCDLDPIAIKPSQYQYAKNIRIIPDSGPTYGSIAPVEAEHNSWYVDMDPGSIITSASVRNVSAIFCIKDGSLSVYRITKNTDESVSSHRSFSISDYSPASISPVIRYEDADNIKLYWADGANQILVANISESADDKNSAHTDINYYYIIPSSDLDKPTINSIGTGRLLSGRIQYAYQAYSGHGSSTAMSPLSNIVDILIKDGVGGAIDDVYGEQAGRSVKIEIDPAKLSGFSGIKVYSIYYYNYGSTPVITLIKDLKLGSVDETIYITDSGASSLAEYTIDEFALIASNFFSASRIETKNNMLFAAGISDLAFDVEYDTRSYQFNLSGTTRLYSNSGEYSDYTISTIQSIDKSADCIHDEIYSKERYGDLEYIYDLSGNYGGSGVNVDYIFINTALVGSSAGGRSASYASGIWNKYIDDRITRVGATNSNISKVLVNGSDGSTEAVDIKSFGVNEHIGRLDYSNPYISSVFSSHKRDEIYRFAAVLHSSDGRKSNAKWIADIRFPDGYISNGSWSSNIFEMPEDYGKAYSSDTEVNSYLSAQELIIKPLGLKFTFKNIPSGVSKIEIVRSKRDINNRTIYASGVLQKVGTFADANLPTNISGLWYYDTNNYGTLRPHPIISMGYSYGIAPSCVGVNGIVAGNLPSANSLYDSSINYSAYSSMYPYNTGSIGSGTGSSAGGSSMTSMAPYFSKMNIFGFISPEVSYNGEEFYTGLKDATSDLKVVVSSVIYPKCTPILKNLNVSTSNTTYIGRQDHDRFKSIYDGAGYPTAMYAAADLTEKLVSLEDAYKASNLDEYNNYSMLFTAGLAGMSHDAILGLYDTPKEGSDVQYRAYDISPDVSYEANTNGKLLVSGVGVIRLSDISGTTHQFLYRSGISKDAIKNGGENEYKIIGGDNASSPYAFRTKDVYLQAGLGSITFKYFNSYRKSMIDESNGTNYDSVRLVKQTAPQLSSYDATTYTSIGDIPHSSVLDIKLAKSQSNPVAHQAITDFVFIGGKPYSNFSKSLSNILFSGFYSDSDQIQYRNPSMINRSRMSGLHGSMLLIDTGTDTIPSISRVELSKKKFLDGTQDIKHLNIEKRVASGLGTLLVNLKQMNSSIYGGNSYQDRQFSEYITTGCFVRESGDAYVFSGDTFISMFDYTVTKALDQTAENFTGVNDNENWWNDVCLGQTMRVGALIPVESSINTMVDSGETYADNNNILVQDQPGAYSIGASSGATYQASQSKSEFVYNPAYSSDATVIGYSQDIIGEEKNKKYDCRIINSEKKTNDELYDSWSIFKPANYIDVDSKYGPITGLSVFRDRLYFMQENGVGVSSVNERSLISDASGSQLSLGTSGVLSRYDYVSEENGLSKLTPYASISSDTGIYFYDKNRNVICNVTDRIEVISKTKGVQSVVGFNKYNFLDSFTIGKNTKYNELLFTGKVIKDPGEEAGNSGTIMYSEQLSVFESMLTTNPSTYSYLDGETYCINPNGYINKINGGYVISYSQVPYIRFIVNGDYEKTKIFDNVELHFSENNIGARILSAYYSTTRQNSAVSVNADFDNREGTKKLSIPRESLEKFAGRMRDKYLVCNYNIIGGETTGAYFSLPYIKTNYRYSFI